VIDILLNSKLNNVMHDHWMYIESCIGLGQTEEAIDRIRRVVFHHVDMGVKIASVDFGKFDATVNRWDFENDDARRCYQYSCTQMSLYSRIQRSRSHCELRPVYVYSDGLLEAKNVPCGHNSGRFDTSDGNTDFGVFNNTLCGCDLPTVENGVKVPGFIREAGDDALVKHVENYKEKMAALGKVVKYYQVDSDVVEFCSMKITRTTWWPLNMYKALYGFLCRGKTQSQLDQFFRVFQNSPFIQEAVDVLDGVGWAPQTN